MPRVCGLTGGAGSGKTAVAGVLAECGASIVDTDAIAHALTAAGGAAMPAIVREFGPALAGSDGALDRPRMRELAFGQADARAKLERIMHPLIQQEAALALDRASGEVAFLVVPLLFEKMSYRSTLDWVVGVDCSVATQVERVARRPGVGMEQARAIVQSQISRAVRLQLADEVIHNEGSLEELAAKVRALYERLRIEPKIRSKL
jgi:dephospho-CoA kinase